MGGFDFLQGISPWTWAAFGIVLGALEMATMSFFLIWPALAALVMAVVIFIAPDLGTAAQIILWAVLSVLLTLVGRKVVMDFGDGGGEETLINNRAAQLVGRTGKVIVSGDIEGAIEVDGIRWRASWPDGSNLAEGSPVTVVANRGMLLEVTPVS